MSEGYSNNGADSDIREIFKRLNEMSKDMATLVANSKNHQEIFATWRELHDANLNHEHRLINLEDERLSRKNHEIRISAIEDDCADTKNHETRIASLESERVQRKEGLKAWQMWVALIIISVVEEVLKHVFHL